ncbi:hypothetical protein TVAG_245040 [Trichomonas vaginalis G3]|uniref:Uncharacterized protein n=1 Tax=Trichomonas vaginalis (strain ATCC PRA-98 / G3) TaxID=412133 RepID=A2EMS6_TRIV3|nr:hypothetical protein TVAGG3_0428450 [Trichomonas vaginalis G3]EAY06072.1 hypothetical protein TVAG_245040 [Trichomonas vaginalis G3]KAI5536586.1 hypothetical protein TVAGG3_0428450 [Trichomonas vaginalis G3]|eukprot:XP_001318295.1 hypothetical protein [Trichomonas vaginalis G3]
MDVSLSQLGASIFDKKRELNRIRSEMRTLVKQEIAAADEIIAENKKTYLEKEESELSSIVDKLYDLTVDVSDRKFVDGTLKRNIRENLQEVICSVDQITNQYMKQYFEQYSKKLQHRINLDRAFVDIPENNTDIDIYFGAFSKVTDLNTKNDYVTLLLEQIEQETQRCQIQNQLTMDALNNLIDQKKSEEDEMIELQKNISQMGSTPKNEYSPASYAKIAKNYLDSINSQKNDAFYNCVNSILQEIISDDSSEENIENSLKEIEGLVSNDADQTIPDYKAAVERISEKFKKFNKK